MNAQDQMHHDHAYKIGNIDLIFELNGLAYGYEDSTADSEYINLDVASDNIWLSANAPESSIYVLWQGGTTTKNIEVLAEKLYNQYKACQSSTSIKIAIFEDANGKRHALIADLYKEFKKSCYWLSTYKHITYTERTDLDKRQIKSLNKAVTKVSKFGMFDLVGNGWTLQGDVAMTNKQATQQKAVLTEQSTRLTSWEHSMKRMGMLPSAAGTILGKMSEEI